jgi:hypothetical protein
MTEMNIAIRVYTDAGMFFGIIAVPSRLRLFDFINLPPQYLHFMGKEVTNIDEPVSNLNEIHINKKAVKFLTTVFEDDGRGVGVKETVYQLVQKKTVSVKISMCDYEITGNLHSSEEGSVSDLLEKNLPFLPCTEVKIHSINNNRSWDVSFAAINKNNISAMEKVDKA